MLMRPIVLKYGTYGLEDRNSIQLGKMGSTVLKDGTYSLGRWELNTVLTDGTYGFERWDLWF